MMMMMMKPQAQPSCSSARSSRLLPPKPISSVILSSPSFLNIFPRPVHHHLLATKHYLRKNNCIRATSSSSKSSVDSTTTTNIKAVVTVQVQETIASLDKTFLLELVSADLDPETGSEKETIRACARKVSQNETIVTFESELRIPADFGDIGAVLVENEHDKEAYIKSIELTGFPNGTSVNFPCNSWIHSKDVNKEKRIFFTNKPYIPSKTPSGIKKRREEELKFLRGNGEGERKSWERIYDYDTYNDLGDPDADELMARPVLGGNKDHPYPRRCRTGRPPTETDPFSEKSSVYVPRDEAFAKVKQCTVPLSTETLQSRVGALHLHSQVKTDDPVFPDITAAIDSLFKAISDGQNGHLLLGSHKLLDRDNFSLFNDEEFSRQTLAGVNPYSIQLVTEWPLKSKLCPKIYGSPESLITKKLVETEISMSVDEALKRKKLFILDYHDLLMPYVKKVRDIKGTTLYGSRTLFFLTENGTLRPLAIELTRPPIRDNKEWKKVFTPTRDETDCWLWSIAKAHVCAHDSAYHQLVIHWLRTHCCTEPYIIAANRQLSAMHPIYRLLHPHFRYTMAINALARRILINAGGTIETCFSPAKYSIELSSTAYDQLWRFDLEALPADLIRRGMAVEDQDPTAEHGLKLTIEDYPFANDGLILWDAIKEWVDDYVNHYYPDPTLVESDNELQAWWTDVRTKGHEDKKDEPWWPVLKTPQDLVHILTTIIWVTAGHHAAVNFGQYMYAGYFPNRPTIARSNIPTEDGNEERFKMFLKKPESALLRCFPSQVQATKVMAVLDVLSNHSPDEEYIGENVESSWAEDPVIKAAFERFNGNLKKLEGIIDERNTNVNLKNRVGAGVVPYELLKPFSESGVTGKGVPNSISI